MLGTQESRNYGPEQLEKAVSLAAQALWDHLELQKCRSHCSSLLEHLR